MEMNNPIRPYTTTKANAGSYNIMWKKLCTFLTTALPMNDVFIFVHSYYRKKSKNNVPVPVLCKAQINSFVITAHINLTTVMNGLCPYFWTKGFKKVSLLEISTAIAELIWSYFISIMYAFVEKTHVIYNFHNIMQ